VRKLLLYKDLINLKNINEIFENKNYNNNIIPFEKYINNNINEYIALRNFKKNNLNNQILIN